MMRRGWRFLFLGLTIAILMALTLGAAAAQGSKILVTAVQAGDPQSIDPQRASDQGGVNLSTVLFPGLSRLDEAKTHEVVPGITTGWDVSADGKTYTFHIIPNIPWVRYNADSGKVEQVMDESGKPRYVTAADVVYGFTRALDPATGAVGAYMLAPVVAGGDKFNTGGGAAADLDVKAVDDFTFQVTGPESVAYAIGIYGLITGRATPKWAIDDAGDSWTEPENINSYGPFALKEWVHDDHMTFVKNPFWPGSPGYGQAKLDELVVKFMDENTQLREYEAGNLDVVILVPSDQYDRVSADPVLSKELTVFAGMCSTDWNFHTQKPPFDNVHLRRAFSYAVDRQSLADNILKGGRIPARWYTPPSIAFAPTLEDNPTLGISFDPDKAKAELALGLKDLSLSSVDGLPSITVDFGDSPVNNTIGQALQVMWKDTLGVTVTLNPMDRTTYWTLMGQDAGQIHAGGWCPDYNDANNYTHDVLYSTSSNNFGRWNNPEFDGLIDKARVSSDPAERRTLYAQAEELEIVDQAATIPLVWEGIATLTKPYVTRTLAPSRVESYWDWDISPH